MQGDPVNPEGCLRSLAAEALLWAPHRQLFPESVSLMAVANAFVMLGLLPEPRAEAILADHRSALERMGLGDTWGVTEGELTLRPGAHEYWQSRMAGPGGLREVPLLVAAAGMCCPASVAEVCFEWVKLTSTGWQLLEAVARTLQLDGAGRWHPTGLLHFAAAHFGQEPVRELHVPGESNMWLAASAGRSRGPVREGYTRCCLRDRPSPACRSCASGSCRLTCGSTRRIRPSRRSWPRA